MNQIESGMIPATFTAINRTMPNPTKPQRARVLASTYWRCLAYCSWTSWCSRLSACWTTQGNLHPEQVARLQEEPIRGAPQVAEAEGRRLAERGAVPEKEHRARCRLVGEQEVVPEPDGREPRLGQRVNEKRPAAAGIAQTIALL